MAAARSDGGGQKNLAVLLLILKTAVSRAPNLTPLRPLPLPAVVVYFHSSVGAGLSLTDLFISWGEGGVTMTATKWATAPRKSLQ